MFALVINADVDVMKITQLISCCSACRLPR